ncbi:preprotein translocase subunit YajC [Fuchsiella alkaliacetigena]|uniref:preprotein translocase subunit YajC n=1 Tax=Fuchsiella alkaliacetigena TaxID=957042 RepID=UPI00200A4D9E|nr:preprotein translocase subunit YajC [Fuchsiella alkaliacetigena]MCK8825216.1 preprotein translocase subunit YajC [Fuchsiella alkaliacetigena]
MDAETILAFLPWILIFGVFWFIFIRPQRKRQKERDEMLDNLQEGDEIVTIGGIKGKIIELEEDSLKIQITPEVEIEMIRSAIGNLANVEQEE